MVGGGSRWGDLGCWGGGGGGAQNALTSPCPPSTHTITINLTLTFAASPLTPQYVRKLPPQAPRKPQNLCTLAADSPNPKTDHILGYVAQNAISSGPNPPATTHFWWFPALKIVLTDA